MERSLYYVRLVPGTEQRYDQRHAEIPDAVAGEMREAGLRDVTGYRRGTDVWWYAACEPDRTTAFRAYATGQANRRWGKRRTGSRTTRRSTRERAPPDTESGRRYPGARLGF